MAKFGELIDKEVPVVVGFYSEISIGQDDFLTNMRDLGARYGKSAEIIRVDVDKNRDLSEALRIKKLPTMIVYHRGEMKLRVTGDRFDTIKECVDGLAQMIG